MLKLLDAFVLCIGVVFVSMSRSRECFLKFCHRTFQVLNLSFQLDNALLTLLIELRLIQLRLELFDLTVKFIDIPRR